VEEEDDEGKSIDRLGDVIASNTAKRQSAAYAGFCQRGSLPSLFWGAHMVGGRGYTREMFKIYRVAIAVEKPPRRRRQKKMRRVDESVE